MSSKLHSDQKGEATVVPVRLPSALLEALDQVLADQKRAAPLTNPTRSGVARGLLEQALRAYVPLGQPEAVAAPAPTLASTPAPTPTAAPPKPARRAPAAPEALTQRAGTKPRKPTLREAVLAALRAAERPGKDTVSIVAVVQACLVQHPVDAIHTMLRTLDREGVIEMRPDSGYASDFTPEDRALCLPSQQPGEVLTAARWLKRPA